MTSTTTDIFGARDTFETGSGRAAIYRLSALQKSGIANIERLPFSIKVLLESVLRNCDGHIVTEDYDKEIAFAAIEQFVQRRT